LKKKFLIYIGYVFYYFVILASLDLLIENRIKIGNYIPDLFLENNYGVKFTKVKIGNFIFAIWVILNAAFALSTITRKKRIAKAYNWWLWVVPGYTSIRIFVNVVRVSYYAGFSELIVGNLKINEFINNFSDLKLNFTYFTKDFQFLIICGLIAFLHGLTVKQITNANKTYI